MCEMYGFTILSGKFEEQLGKTQLMTLFNNLALLSEDKTHDTMGVTIVNDNNIKVLKRNLAPKKLLISVEYSKFLQNNLDPASTFSAFGQSKSKSAGEEAYPIVAESMVGMFEGSVINTVELYQEFGKFFEKKTKAEGEIVFNMLNYYRNVMNYSSQMALQKTAQRLKGFSNFICVDAYSPCTVYIVKESTNPINAFVYNKAGLVVYASSDECITKAAALIGLQDEEKILIPMHYATIICAHSNKYEKLIL